MKSIKPVSIFLIVILLKALRVDAQDINKITLQIELKGATMGEAFTRIEKLTPFKFNYKSADIAGISGIWYKQQHITVKKLLDDLLSNTSLQYEIIQNYILIKKINRSPAH